VEYGAREKVANVRSLDIVTLNKVQLSSFDGYCFSLANSVTPASDVGVLTEVLTKSPELLNGMTSLAD